MKAFYILSGVMAAAVMSLTNCQPAEIVPESIPESGTDRITVTTENTRTANSGMSTVWSADDALNIFTGIPNSGYPSQGKASIEKILSNGNAIFTFNYTDSPTASVDWYVLYPYNSANTTPNSLAVNVGAASVTQNGYDSMAHLAGSLCPLYGIAKGKTVNEATVKVHQLCSVVEFDVTNNTGISLKVKSVKLDATEEVVGGFTLNLIGSEPVITAASASKAATVNISNPSSLANGSVAKAYLPIKPYKHSTANKLNVTVTLEADGKTVDVPFHLTVSSAAKGTFSSGLIKPVGLTVTSDMLFGSMKITSMTAKCHKATIVGEAAAVGTSVIQYRKSGAGSWTSASSTVSGSTVTAELTGLDDNTTYEVRVSAGSVNGPSKTFTTKKEGAQLYNMSFDNWYKDGSKWRCYPSGASDSEKIWANANDATTYLGFGDNGASPEESNVVSGKATKLISQVIAGNFAAGSLFTGSFGSFSVLSGKATIYMGIPFTDRPDALEGWAKYISKTIDNADKSHSNEKGKSDSGRVFVLLTNWNSSFAVTPPNTLIDFNHNTNSSIIGYGEKLFKSTDSKYNEFTIPIEYYSDSTPTYVVVCGASSALGDYFTGGKGSTLYIDEFKFIYE